MKRLGSSTFSVDLCPRPGVWISLQPGRERCFNLGRGCLLQPIVARHELPWVGMSDSPWDSYSFPHPLITLRDPEICRRSRSRRDCQKSCRSPSLFTAGIVAMFTTAFQHNSPVPIACHQRRKTPVHASGRSHPGICRLTGHAVTGHRDGVPTSEGPRRDQGLARSLAIRTFRNAASVTLGHLSCARNRLAFSTENASGS